MCARTYDKEFKLNALSLRSVDKSDAQICRDLGIPESTFSDWVRENKKEGDKAFVGSGNIRASNVDKYALQKELRDVKIERDILKKALAIFSQQR